MDTNAENSRRNISYVDFLESSLHDVKTPLAIIEMALQGIISAGVTEGAEHSVEMIRKYTESMKEILEGVNEYSKVISKGPDWKTVDIVAAIQEFISGIKVLTEQKKLCINFTSNVAVKEMLTDSLMLGRIMFNLLSNAIKASSEHGKINVRVNEVENVLTVFVEDEGDGFPEYILTSGIKRYNTVINEHNPKGMGVGLCATKGFIELLDGALELGNGVNGGAIAAFTLPIREAEKVVNQDEQLELEL